MFSALLVQFFSVCTKTWICSYAPDDSAVHRALGTCGPSVQKLFCVIHLVLRILRWLPDFWKIFGSFC